MFSERSGGLYRALGPIHSHGITFLIAAVVQNKSHLRILKRLYPNIGSNLIDITRHTEDLYDFSDRLAEWISSAAEIIFPQAALHIVVCTCVTSPSRLFTVQNLKQHGQMAIFDNMD